VATKFPGTLDRHRGNTLQLFPMRFVFRLFLLLLILTPLALAALVWFSLSPRPAVALQVEASHADIERAKQVLKMNDPRSFPPGTEHTVRMSERDIVLSLNYLVRKLARGAVQASAQADRLELAGTVDLPLISARPYLNIAARIEAENGVPRVSRLRIGSVPVPAFVAAWALERVMQGFNLTQEYRLAGDMIRRLDLRPGEVSVGYRWQPDTLRTLGAQLAGIDSTALAAYHAQLLALQARGTAREGSVTAVLQSMFALARQRSAEGDPVAENRALLLVIGAWAGGRGMQVLVPQAPDKPARFALSLQQRRDFGRHFLVSAGIAAGSETGLSDAIGVHKEMSDSRGGSGFSFTDIAADRAGTRFGKLATASADSARRIQHLLSQGLTEADIMPAVLDLPEGLSEAEFDSRYTAVDSPAYRAVLDEIDRRIATCALYRG
jgi:uncharacterized protein YfiM (DUF2279 family)